MKWLLVSNPTSLLIEYHLVYQDIPLIILKYNPIQHSARVSCNEYKRLFFVESTGSLNHKMIIRNEYGLQIGSVGYEKWNSKDGTITLDEHKFSYALNPDSYNLLSIYQNGGENPLVSFGIKNNNSIPNINLKLTGEQNCLLIAVCWYLFLPVSKEHIPAFARKIITR